MQDIVGKNISGTYAVQELRGTLHNERLITSESFSCTLQSAKLNYDIWIEQEKQYGMSSRCYLPIDSFKFYLQFKTGFSTNMISFIILSDRYCNSICKSQVTELRSSDYARQELMLPPISSKDLKTFKCNVGPVYLHIFLLKDVVLNSPLPCMIPSNELKPEKIAVTNTSHYCKFSEGFADLYESKILSDTIIVSESKEFYVHKTILSARSSYFYALFRNDMREAQMGRVHIKNSKDHLVSNVVVENLMQFIYTGVAKDLQKHAFELHELAHMYNILALQEKCVAYWKSTINIDSVVIILIVAKKYNVKELLNEVSTIFKTQTKAIFNSKNFKKLMDMKSIKNN